jgi:adenylate kinase
MSAAPSPAGTWAHLIPAGPAVPPARVSSARAYPAAAGAKTSALGRITESPFGKSLIAAEEAGRRLVRTSWRRDTDCVIVFTMRKYLIVGVPGSGKSTQAATLARDFDLTRISVGNMFRWHVKHHTKIGAQVRQAMAAGELVGDELVKELVTDRLEQHDWNYGFVIDGFPRNRQQAEFFAESWDVDAVIYLDLPDSQVRHRVLSRRLCTRCGVDYALMESRPRHQDSCDNCGGELMRREDDTPEALAGRVRDYHHITDPALELLRRKTHVHVIDANRDPAAVQRDIRARLGLSPDGSGPVGDHAQ